MFDFGNANDAQKQAIKTTEGPLLITAGPGTGKTFTLVQRAIYLITECGIAPEQIMIATFTEKAAKELITRITNELSKRDIVVNLNDMYIGTFHSICLRIIKEHLEYTRIKKSYRMLDTFDQQYEVFQHINRFREAADLDATFETKNYWTQAGMICNFAANLMEEQITSEEIQQDRDPKRAIIGKLLAEYLRMLDEENLVDFASIQTEAYALLTTHPEVLESIQSQIQYLMIDEYQDINYIQEQLVFLIAGERQNICVVGDDDQGLYRFRGATIRNILEFPQKFPEGACKIISLVVNYRSNSTIVDFYNRWMETTDGEKFKFDWGRYRFPKTIVPHEMSTMKSPAVIKLPGNDDADDWHERVLNFIIRLRDSGKITDYNQVAFLFASVKNPQAVALADYLESNGINVYSPRSGMYFQRDEIRLLIGCLMLMFPNYVVKLEQGDYDFYLRSGVNLYYEDCIKLANQYLTTPEGKPLRKWMRERGKEHAALIRNTDYAYTGLIYRMLEYEPFASFVGADLHSGVVDLRPTRNVAMFTQLTAKFEYLHGITVLTGSEKNGIRRIDANTERFFNTYLRLLYEGGIGEFEDDAEYAPSGCVSFLTIHQSKGMEFPIVFVDSLKSVPRKRQVTIAQEIIDLYGKRPAYEPEKDIKYFDFWRLYYTAFSRAQDLLVLTCNEGKSVPSRYFKELYNPLALAWGPEFDLSEFAFHQVKTTNLKNTFSFTSHITVYETCAVQYKFFKELEFSPVRMGSLMFGTLVHATIEDIHKAALRGEESTITHYNIERWFDANYAALSKAQKTYLAEAQRAAALTQVLRYADRQRGQWGQIKDAEVDVSLVMPEYIIDGKIDLIKGEGGTVELVDFKSERKPDMFKDQERIERYRRQLQLYAYLVEQRTGEHVSKMHLYYTAEDGGVPTVTFPYQKTAIDATMRAFDDTVQKILRKEYTAAAKSAKTCSECDFRFYCGK